MLKKICSALLIFAVLVQLNFSAYAEGPKVKLGNERLLTDYKYLVEGKKVGLITNQTGVNSEGESIINVFAKEKSFKLAALYSPEHGLDGLAKAGAYVKSYTHPTLGIPVYSLYGASRMPSEDMLKNIDVLIFDIQDIGARTYTYISTMNYAMVAAQKYNKPIIILDRPNPVGGTIVEGPMLEDKFTSFVGIDNLPMAHGMTIGELAKYFNRKINANLTVVTMEGYTRDMVFQDTELPWKMTSPNIPDLLSAFGYMATGLGEGTGIFMEDKFKWIGGKGIDENKFAELLNNANLPGVKFLPEKKWSSGGVRLQITDFHTFNPAKTGIYALTYAHMLNNFAVPKSGAQIIMFDKVMGTDKFGQWLEQGLTPQQIEDKYRAGLEAFKKERQKYLIYAVKGQNKPENPKPPVNRGNEIAVFVGSNEVTFDAKPYIDRSNRVMVPFRAIAEALGATVTWNNASKTVEIYGSGISIKFTINQKEAVVSGEKKLMDTTPVIKDNRVMLPIRYVGEFLLSTVVWEKETKTVQIY